MDHRLSSPPRLYEKKNGNGIILLTGKLTCPLMHTTNPAEPGTIPPPYARLLCLYHLLPGAGNWFPVQQ